MKTYVTPFRGPKIPNESYVLSSNFQQRQKQASSIQLESPQKIFWTYALNARDGWTRDPLVANAEVWKNNTASEVYVKRFKAEKWEFIKSRRTLHISMCKHFNQIGRMVRIVIPPTRADLVRIWLKTFGGCLLRREDDGRNMVVGTLWKLHLPTPCYEPRKFFEPQEE